MDSNLLIEWLADPVPIITTLAGVALAAFLYWRGAQYTRQTGIGRPVRTLQALAFASSLFLLVVAVASPVDTLADQSLAVHMFQHELLVLVIPPLLLLGEPFWRMWRGLPVEWRRESLRWLVRRRRARQVGQAVEAFVKRPIPVLLTFLAVLFLWHIPAIYDAALRIEALHAIEHASFLVVGLLFWAQVIPSFPLRPHLSYIQRAGYLFVTSLVMHLFAILIAIANRPIYPYYGEGETAVAHQTAGGAVMDVSGMVVFTIAILICLWLWLRDDDKAGDVEEPAVPVTVAETSARGALLLMEAGAIEPGADHPAREE